MLEPVSNKVDFPGMETGVLAFWEREDIFRRSIEARRGAPDYVFYDGPPFATGLPHYGHLLAGTIKDIVPRYQTMRGRRVERRFGWDCHGLPIEALAQEKLGLAGAAAIVEKGVDVFNETCRSMVLRYVSDWRRIVARMGRWVDFDNDYKTMDPSFMETIWWVFKQLWDQGRIYKSYRIMPYSWKLTTPLSNFEAGSNYQDVQDPSITVRLRLTRHALPGVAADAPAHALIWTTTPWTLPSNLALAAGPDIDYVAVRDAADGAVYVLAAARLAAYYKSEAGYAVVARLKGRDLEGWTYEPMFPYFAGRPGAFRILVDPFVTTEDGTGLVHLAPAYGEDDFRVCRAAGIELVDPLDESARFTGAVPDYRGQFCKDADKAIVKRLKAEGKLVHQSTIVHSYPFCERTDTPLIYRAIEAWYVRVEDLREPLVANSAGVHWVPAHVGGKRFGNWLREAKDWNISRNRFWGSCLPVWIAEDDPSDMICVGSIRELEERSGVRVTDLHKHVVDRVVIRRNGRTYRRTPEVLDCWFESGSMPYAQHHYPFAGSPGLDRFFPAEFIAEGLDQTRGWFYTLLVLSTALFGKSAFRNVVVNGLILAEDGRKMSKRLKNYPDPAHIIDTYGADALRLYMINSPVVRAEDLCFSEEGVKQSLRNLLIPLWNAYAFFVTYARVDGWTPAATPPPAPAGRGAATGQGALLDRWIRSSLDRLTQEVVEAMDRYDLQQAVRPFVAFIDDLTNWYIRRSRRRFWKSGDDADKASAYATLYDALRRLSRIAAPFLPFTSEAIHRNLRAADEPESVHLCDYPVSDGAARDPALEEQMEAVKTVVSLGRQLRAQYDLKVRQPLAGLHVVCRDAARRARIEAMRDLVADELNVKEVWFGADESPLAHLKAKANFRALGPLLGPDVKKAAAVIHNLGHGELERLLAGGTVAIQVGERQVELGGEQVVVQRVPKDGLAVSAAGDLVVALETRTTPELESEGLAREFVNRVQNLRKMADLEVTQRIRLRFSGDGAVARAVEAHRAYIMEETLAVDLDAASAPPVGAEATDLNGHPCAIRMEAGPE
jgi:isoleucyl-tRNA synthetase